MAKAGESFSAFGEVEGLLIYSQVRLLRGLRAGDPPFHFKKKRRGGMIVCVRGSEPRVGRTKNVLPNFSFKCSEARVKPIKMYDAHKYKEEIPYHFP